MAVKDPETIKRIVRSNFDESALLYERFERKYGLFRDLTRRLAYACGIEPGMNVIDVGCGTGASSSMLAVMVAPKGRVTGVDFSRDMLDVARDRLKNIPNAEFILADAETLDECIDTPVDSVLFNATIFLIPATSRALESAHGILKKGGIVGMNYLTGIFDGGRDDGVELFRWAGDQALDFAPYGRGIADMKSLPRLLEEVGFGHIREGTVTERMPLEEVRDFYGIPAQSAGLYPRTPYGERLGLLDSLLEYLAGLGITHFHQGWGWCTGVK
jgi:SAM-dependent methyltransferase